MFAKNSFLFFLTAFIVFIICIQISQSMQCGKESCIDGNSRCNGNYCECHPDYWSKKDDKEKCNYKRRKQSIYLILEAIPSFGVGHIYARRYVLGGFKMAYWLLSCVFLILMRYYSEKRNKYDETALKHAFISCILTIGMIVWWIVDFILILLCRYRDGNNIDLLSFWDYLKYPDIN